jgi:hypothetical protein
MTTLERVLIAPLAVAAFLSLARPLRAQTTSITLDGTKSGRTFDGVGAISGGGGNTRLLYDYPEPQRSQILDYLFKPGYGAAIQVLKVEVGGDANSTDGAEPSHEHVRGSIDCNRGYEWWLMEQAKARNPNIKLAGLAWTAPGWIGGHNFWSQDMIEYYESWLECGKAHGLTIDYLGGWNEKAQNDAWFKDLDADLASKGYATRVVASDRTNYTIADEMASDGTLKAAIDVIGTHYTCGYKPTTSGTTCTTNANALASGKAIWLSETGSQDYMTGATAMSRVYVTGYIQMKITGYLNWPVIAALTPNLGWNTMGLMLAREPWAGSYSLGKQLWATAHHTQFAAPGWKYIDSASGYLGGAIANGAYVTRKAPNNVDWSVVVETMDATASQTASFTITGGLSTGTVHVWATDMRSTSPSSYFVQQADITPSGGKFSLTVQPGRVYSLTNKTGAGKGTAAGLPAGQLALPYVDDFESYAPGREARYLADMDGAFEVRPCTAGRAGQCVRQMAEEAPIAWGTLANPTALLGDTRWTDYTVSADFMLPRSGWVDVQGRVGTQGPGGHVAKVEAYFVRMNSSGSWSILKSDTTATLTTLASGTTNAPGTGSWHTLSATFSGSTITGRLDGAAFGSADDASYAAGQIGIACSGWVPAEIDNLRITTGSGPTPTPTPGPTPTPSPTPTPGGGFSGYYKLIARHSGKAVVVLGASTTNGADVIQYAYGGTATNDEWQFSDLGGGYYRLLNRNSGQALNVKGGATVDGGDVIQWPAGGATSLNDQWQPVDLGGGYHRLVNRKSGKVLDVAGASTSNGANVDQWSWANASQQQFEIISVP